MLANSGADRRGRCVHPPSRSVNREASSMVTAGTGAATVHGKGDASKSAIARVALQPRRTWRQKQSRPTPNGDTTPIPVIATRGVRRSHLSI